MCVLYSEAQRNVLDIITHTRHTTISRFHYNSHTDPSPPISPQLVHTLSSSNSSLFLCSVSSNFSFHDLPNETLIFYHTTHMVYTHLVASAMSFSDSESCSRNFFISVSPVSPPWIANSSRNCSISLVSSGGGKRLTTYKPSVEVSLYL